MDTFTYKFYIYIFHIYWPEQVELMVAPLEHGQSGPSSRVSISFNLLGGWEPPLTTVGHTWSTATPLRIDSQTQSDVSSGTTCNVKLKEDKDADVRAATGRFDGGMLLPQLWRLMLWTVCQHLLARRGHGGLLFSGLFFVVAAIALALEQECLRFFPTALSGADNAHEAQPPLAFENNRGGVAPEVDLQSLPLDCRFGLSSERIDCPVNSSIFEGLTSADLRDSGTLLALADAVKQQFAQVYGGTQDDQFVQSVSPL